jgi:hypothetical protein
MEKKTGTKRKVEYRRLKRHIKFRKCLTRCPYNNYYRADTTLQSFVAEVFDNFYLFMTGRMAAPAASGEFPTTLMEVSLLLEIKYRTVVSRYRLYREERKSMEKKGGPHQSAVHVVAGIHDRRGQWNRIFSLEDELELANYINEVYIETGAPFRLRDAAIVALAKFKALHPYRTRSVADFKMSPGWLNDFKKKFYFSCRTPRLRRIAVHEATEEEIKMFVSKVGDYRRRWGDHRVLNMDETFIRAIDAIPMVLGRQGHECRPVLYKGNDKDGLTAVLTITASGKKLPNIFIKKGKTVRCEKSLDVKADSGDLTAHSKKGWVDSNIIQSHLYYVVKPYAESINEKVVLIWDVHSSHVTDAVKRRAEACGIDLLWIPPGMTSSLQPLDLRVNGAIKCSMRSLWRDRILQDPLQSRSMADTIKDFKTAYGRVNKETIVKSFDLLSK